MTLSIGVELTIASIQSTHFCIEFGFCYNRSLRDISVITLKSLRYFKRIIKIILKVLRIRLRNMQTIFGL